MKFIQTPVKGMQDFLPLDMELRSHVLSVIRDTYRRYGFSEIETPVMEHIENLSGRDGGENEKLIFKVLKRGRELEKGLKSGELCDSALRYDLTVPLCRYYSEHKNELPTPFKALQIGNVFRADRPQKGRFRQFTQCDIDILGDPSVMAEIELIGATTTALSRIFSEVSISAFTVHLNDRRILKAMAKKAGFEEKDYDEIFILLDKMDKIGEEGVKEELIKAGYDQGAVESYLSGFSLYRELTEGGVKLNGDALRDYLEKACGDTLEKEASDSLITVMDSSAAIIDPSVTLLFDPTLVRGMSYYTGTIFEITIDNYSFSIAGGGRYDHMVGRFSGAETPACGFSIGFERIFTILRDLRWKAPESGEKKAYLVDLKGASGRIQEVFAHARAERDQGAVVTVEPLKKNAKFQIDTLEKSGYTSILKVYADTKLS